LEITSKEFFYTTADNEDCYFTGERQMGETTVLVEYLPSGNYQVIDGELFLIVDGVPSFEKD
jgi:hypothetical protein